MKMTDWFLAELDEEAPPTRRTLERVPEGRNDWTPHEKSMPLGYLAGLVASLPSWVGMTIKRDEYDLSVTTSYTTRAHSTRSELLSVFDAAVREGREALAGTSEEHLLKSWRLLMSGRVVAEQPRCQMLRNGIFSHLAHHRGQLTVYLRLLDAPVPAIYGPSADEAGF
jgi:uncharacterized damage-inducible protein DinB